MSIRRDTLAGPGWGVPDLAVILSGGGARAAYQVGVLAAIAEKMPTLQIPIITGVSAGAINAAFLAAYTGPLDRGVAELRGQWLRLTADQVYSLPTKGIAATAFRMIRSAARRLRRREGIPAVRGLLDMRPLARFLEGIIPFEGIERNIQEGRLKALALSSTSYDNGKTYTFVQARPDIPVWERAQRVALRKEIGLKHVMASSAIPIIFPAVKLDGGFYGDGSVRLTAPLAPAIHLGAGRLLTIGMRSTATPHYEPPLPTAEYPSAAAIGALLLHSVFLDALDADVERLERLNRLLRMLPPGAAPDGLKPVDVYLVRPSRDLGEMARGYWPRLPLVMDFLVRSMGIHEERGADFLSYLLFEPDYHGLLMELGHEDALAQWDRLGAFLEGR